jgi:hypothetical protein
VKEKTQKTRHDQTSGKGGRGFSTDLGVGGVPRSKLVDWDWSLEGKAGEAGAVVRGSANGLDTDNGRRKPSDESLFSSGLVTATAGIVTCCASELAGESMDARA